MRLYHITTITLEMLNGLFGLDLYPLPARES